MAKKLMVNDTEITIISVNERDYISLTDMLKAKDDEEIDRLSRAMN